MGWSVLHAFQDMYLNWLDGLDVHQVVDENDPFWEPPESQFRGTSSVFLQSLSYGLDFDDKTTIADLKGEEQGFLYAHIMPCDELGEALDENYFVDEPDQLLGHPYHFKVCSAL